MQLSITDPTPVAGELVTVTALVRHRARFALRAQVLWQAGGHARTTPLTLAPDEAAFAELDWRAAGRGPFEIRVPSVIVVDPLGLIVRRVRIGARIELLILPRTIDALAGRLRGAAPAMGPGALGGDQALGNDTGAPAGAVRDYRTGDPLRQIHWKQSARQGELLVNLHETAGSAQRALLLVHDRDAFATPEEFELAVSAAATLASQWLREGHPIRLHLSAESSALCSTEGEMLRALSYARLGAGGASRMVSGLSPPPHAVITGNLDECLVRELAQFEAGGILLAHRRDPGAATPQHWRAFEIPDPTPSGGSRRPTEANPAEASPTEANPAEVNDDA